MTTKEQVKTMEILVSFIRENKNVINLMVNDMRLTAKRIVVLISFSITHLNFSCFLSELLIPSFYSY